jgi:hypothetical protein
MKNLGIAIGIVWLLIGFSVATWAVEVQTAGLKPLGYCQLTSITAATKLTTCANGIPAGAEFVLIEAETQNARWRDDGTAPTTTVGMLLITTASTPTLYQGDLTAIQFINATAGTIVDVSFYQFIR